jgi:HK97 family phage major capsid protein
MKIAELAEKLKTDKSFSCMVTDAVKSALAQELKGLKEVGESRILTAGDIKPKVGGNYIALPNGWLKTPQGSTVNPTPSAKGAGGDYWKELSTEMNDWAEDFMKLLKSNGRNVGKTLEESTSTAGGFLVPDEFQASVVMYDAPQAIVWPRANIFNMTTEKLGMPKLSQVSTGTVDHFAGVVFSWTDEGGTKSETEPDFEFLELIVHELSGYTEITDTLIADSAINIMNFLTRLFRAAYMWITDKIFFDGDGAKKPLGIITDPATIKVNRITAGTVKWTDMINMDIALPAHFGQNAVWNINKSVWLTLRNERDTNNALLFKEYADVESGVPRAILGYPVVYSDNKTSAIGSKGDVTLGDWQHYYVGNRMGLRIDSSTHYQFRNNKTSVRIVGRLDGQAAQPKAFVILDLTSGGS